MANDCYSPSSQVMVLPCAGGSNVGQIANRVAMDLTVEGLGKIFWLTGIGADICGMIQLARDCP